MQLQMVSNFILRFSMVAREPSCFSRGKNLFSVYILTSRVLVQALLEGFAFKNSTLLKEYDSMISSCGTRKEL